MAYIGKTPTIGNFQKCDAITVVNGQAAYTMQVGGTNVSPESENHMLVSLNGILQAPVDSFTISGSTITFASNLATGDVIDFIMLLGNVLDLGTPSDNTVSTAKLVDSAVTSAKINDGAITSGKLASGVGGKILQVVSVTDDTQRSTTSTSFNTMSSTLTLNITPSSTSSKILILLSTGFQITANDGAMTIYKGSTNLGDSNYGLFYMHVNGAFGMATINYLDSPSTTSQVTYTMYARNVSGASTVKINNESGYGSLIAMEIGA